METFPVFLHDVDGPQRFLGERPGHSLRNSLPGLLYES